MGSICTEYANVSPKLICISRWMLPLVLSSTSQRVSLSVFFTHFQGYTTDDGGATLEWRAGVRNIWLDEWMHFVVIYYSNEEIKLIFVSPITPLPQGGVCDSPFLLHYTCYVFTLSRRYSRFPGNGNVQHSACFLFNCRMIIVKVWNDNEHLRKQTPRWRDKRKIDRQTDWLTDYRNRWKLHDMMKEEINVIVE